MLYRSILTLLISCAWLLAGTGCSLWPASEQPMVQVKLRTVEVIKARLTEQRLLLHVRIDNNGSQPLKLRGLDFQLSLEGLELAEGRYRKAHWIAAGGHAELAIPVRSNLWPHGRLLLEALRHPQQPLGYHLDARIKRGWLLPPDVHLQRDGAIIPGHFFPE